MKVGDETVLPAGDETVLPAGFSTDGDGWSLYNLSPELIALVYL